MPKLLGLKQFSSLVDVYRDYEVEDEYGTPTRVWDYDDPMTYRCTFMSLNGQTSEWGVYYITYDDVKLEIRPEDAEHIRLENRFGNLRMASDQTQDYYRYVGDRSSSTVPVTYYFEVKGMKPQVDPRGRVVCVEVYGSLAPRM